MSLISQKGGKEFIRNQSAAFFQFVYIKQHTNGRSLCTAAPVPCPLPLYRGGCTQANGRNVVGQQLPRLLDVHDAASVCTPCCMLFRIVGSCYAKFETGQTLEPTTPNVSYIRWSPMCMRYNVGSVYPALSNIVEACTRITYGRMGCIFPTIHCRSQHCWELLHSFAHHR